MKKLSILFLVAMLLAGCAKPVATVTPTTETTTAYYQRHIVWGAQYVRTDHYTQDAQYPQVFVFDSVDALRSYGEYDRLQEYCGGYTEEFFKDRFLVAVLVEEPSGSNSHEVTKIEQTDDKTVICIDRIIPPVGTDDMARWHILAELPAPAVTAAEVQVYLDDRLAWDGGWVEPPKPEAQYKTPPDLELRTPMGDTVLKPAGYSWAWQEPDGTMVSTIADQTARPLPRDGMEELTVDFAYAETIYALVRPGTTYEPTDSLGFFIKLNCPGNPTSVSYTKWTTDGTEESVYEFEEYSFYAEAGSYIYEIALSWEDESAGYFGSANYYVCINGGLLEG